MLTQTSDKSRPHENLHRMFSAAPFAVTELGSEKAPSVGGRPTPPMQTVGRGPALEGMSCPAVTTHGGSVNEHRSVGKPV